MIEINVRLKLETKYISMEAELPKSIYYSVTALKSSCFFFWFLALYRQPWRIKIFDSYYKRFTMDSSNKMWLLM